MPNKSPEPTAVGAVSSAIAVHAASRRWLSFFRKATMTDAKQPNDDGSQSAPKPVRNLPDIAICRAALSFSDYYDCLVVNPWECRYALPFGRSFFCLSPDRAAIAARTKAP